MSACKLKRLHLCGSAPWQKAWVRPSLRGVIDGCVAVVTRHKQEQPVSLFAAWQLALRCAIVTPDVLPVMNRDRESVYWGERGGASETVGYIGLFKSFR